MTTKTLSFDWPYISVCKMLITKRQKLVKSRENHNVCLREGTGTAGAAIVNDLRKYVCVYESALICGRILLFMSVCTVHVVYVCVSVTVCYEASVGLSLTVDCLWPALSLCSPPRGKVLDRSLYSIYRASNPASGIPTLALPGSS